MNRYSIIIIKLEIRSKIRYKQTWQGILQIYSWHLLLLLLLILPRCLDMWTSVPAHIYPHLSKVRLLLETNGGINEQCLQWVPCMPGTQSKMFRCWCLEPTARRVDGLIGCPYQDGTRKEGASTPLGRLEALRSNRKCSCTTYLIPL